MSSENLVLAWNTLIVRVYILQIKLLSYLFRKSHIHVFQLLNICFYASVYEVL